MFKKMPFVLIAEFLLIALIYPYLSMDLKSFLYGVSLSLKSGIVFFLPLIVFSLLFKSAVQMSRQASKWILGILVVICISNFTSTMLSYVVGKAVYGMDLSIALPSEGSSLQPLAAIYLPKWIGNDMAMFSGLLLGIFLGWIRPKGAQTIANFAEIAVLEENSMIPTINAIIGEKPSKSMIKAPPPAKPSISSKAIPNAVLPDFKNSFKESSNPK